MSWQGLHRGYYAFSGQPLSEYLEQRHTSIVTAIEQEQDDYLLQVNEHDYLQHLCSRALVHPLSLKFEDAYATETTQQIPAERFPNTFNVFQGKSYPRPVLTVRIPFDGDAQLLQRRPSTYLTWNAVIYTEGQEVCFDLVDFHSDPAYINQEMQSQLNNLKQSSGYMIAEIESYNLGVEEHLRQVFRARKQQILDRRQLHSNLAVPVKRRGDVVSTFAVPVPPRRQVVVSRPDVKNSGFIPEPTLDSTTYEGILKIVHDVGQAMERKPSTYAGKDEEDLRDHLLTYLESHYESIGSATGETFNKLGKTDILVRYENSNVFLAECKFWGGPKQYLATIDQLLGYLSWRDSKAAAIIFSRNLEFSAVLDAIRATTPKHAQFVEARGVQKDTRFDFQMHLPGDRNRLVNLAVLAFHFPSK